MVFMVVVDGVVYVKYGIMFDIWLIVIDKILVEDFFFFWFFWVLCLML